MTFNGENLDPNPVTNLKLYRTLGLTKSHIFKELKNRNVNNENFNLSKRSNYHFSKYYMASQSNLNLKLPYTPRSDPDLDL